MPANALTLRLTKGTPLTPGEVDGNFTKLRDFANGLEERLVLVADEDGNPSADFLAALKDSSYSDGSLSAAVYSVSVTPAPTAYTAGMEIWMRALTANAGGVDLNVNGLGVKNIFKLVTSELEGGEIPANSIVKLVYDGTNFQLVTVYAAISAAQLSEAARGGVHQYAAGTHSAGVYAITLSPAATQYKTGMRVVFKPNAANTGPVNLNINGLGEKDLFKNVSQELSGGEISANGICEAVYDGSAFQLLTAPGSLTVFTSEEYAINGGAGTIADVAHSLGAVPTRVRWVLVCKTTDMGYAVGDEVDVSSIEVDTDNPGFAAGANATNVFLTRRTGSGLRVANKSTGSPSGGLASNGANWRAKCYAQL